MKGTIHYVSIFLTLTLAVICFTRVQSRPSSLEDNLIHKQINDDEWDHFVFSQQWPMSVCIDSHITHKHNCKIAENVSTWTVHGIWPSLGSSQGPEFCNKTAIFDSAKIQSIKDKLEMFWPNLYTESPLYEFWAHEWDKHGTCAMTLDSLDSELKYFSKGLELSRTFDLLSMLEKGNIVPTDSNTYQYNNFFDVLKGALGDSPTLNCVYDRTTKTQYIIEVQFCLDKTFNVMACPSSKITSAFSQHDSVATMLQIPPVYLEFRCRDILEIAFPTIKRS